MTEDAKLSAAWLLGVVILALAINIAAVAKRANGTEVGIATTYSGRPSEGGRFASNGERINPSAFTAAHRSLPFGRMVTVTNRRNGRNVTVRIIDRGPFKRGRIIDLTPVADSAIGCGGLCPVSIQ